MEEKIIDRVGIGNALHDVKTRIALLGLAIEYVVYEKSKDYYTQSETEGLLESFEWVQKRIEKIEEAVAKRL